MLSVLKAMAANIATRYEETGYTDLLLDVTDVADAYSRVRNEIDAWYYYSFTPGPIGSDEWRRAHPDFQQKEVDGNESYAALDAFAKRLAEQNPGLNISIGVQPSGRPLSDTATVSMDRFGETYLLRVAYSTAWENNFSDVSYLFRMLPEGRYGLAFLDADEYDGYDSVSLYKGLSSGALSSDLFTSESEDAFQAEDLYEEAVRLAAKDLAVCEDLADAALSFAICNWSEYLWSFTGGEGLDDDGESLCDEIDICQRSADHQSFDERIRSSDSSAYSGSLLPASYQHLSDNEISIFVDNVVDLLQRFPFECEVTGQGYEGRNKNIEHLIPGAYVLLKSDWNSPYFAGAGIDVYDISGRRLANLGGYFNPSDIDRITIACLLPHILATAVDVSPLGAAIDGRRKQGQFRLHLEIEPIDLPRVLDEVRLILSADIEDRTSYSLLPE